MQKINLLFVILVFSFSILIVGCNESPVSITADNEVTSESIADFDGIESDSYESDDLQRGRIRNNFLYVSYGNEHYQSGAVFYVNSQGNVYSDIPLIAQNMRMKGCCDSVVVKFEYYGDEITLTAYLINVKYNQVPHRDPIFAFNGLGIVRERKLSYIYDESHGKVLIFDHQNHTQQKMSAERIENEVILSDGRQILPNSLVPDPWQTNVHRLVDLMEYESYLPSFPLPSFPAIR
jgi:hypothetical protein